MNRIRTSTKDYTNDAWIILRKLIVRHNLAEGVKLAHTAADELRGLRTEIKYDNLLLHLFIMLNYCCYYLMLYHLYQ